MNLIEALQKANDDSRKFLQELDDCERLGLSGPGISMSRAITRKLVAETEAAIASGDVMQMLHMAAAHGIGEDKTPGAEEA